MGRNEVTHPDGLGGLLHFQNGLCGMGHWCSRPPSKIEMFVDLDVPRSNAQRCLKLC
jgi:hypothetical protein